VAANPVPLLEGFISDITARRQSEQALRDVEEQLRQSQKMEAIGQLAGGIAHDFNNILQAVRGYSQLLASQLTEDDDRHHLIAEMEQGMERATVLTRQLLAFGRRQVLQLEPLAVDEVMRTVASLLDRLIGEHIELRYSPSDTSVVVTADRGQLEQVLVNLCVNARDAMPRGGQLTLSVERRELDRVFCSQNTWARPGTFVCICVADTGCGIPSEAQEKVFEPFFTTKPIGEGSGLGLSTVYGIVQQHKGLIRLLSEVGVGTTFEVYLPAEQRDVQPARRVSRTSSVPGGTETVLLAEDDAQVREGAQEILGRYGYRVVAAADGEEALELYAAHADEIDVAVLDVIMPGLDGPTVAARLRERRPGLPVVYASGYPAGGLRMDFMLSEGVQLLEKPYAAQKLLQAVRAALKRAR
jgi:nitrogen-specific signal transduction histidine kinase/ActR/RegA family two-component response regulator